MDVWFRVQCFMPPNSLGFVPIDGAICRLDVSARGFAAAWRNVPLSFLRKKIGADNASLLSALEAETAAKKENRVPIGFES